MAGERVKLSVREREGRGTGDSRRLRREGMIPGVLYGRGKQPHAICVEERELRRVLTGDHGLHAILDVSLDKQKTTHASILKDYQVHPVRGYVTHIDLQEVRLDQPIQAQVVVELVGDPEGTVLATVGAPTQIVEPEPEEEELEEGELPEGEVPEGEEAPEGAAEAPAEPEADAAGEQGTVE